MRRKKLGSTDLEISEICLGSMTWGTQNTKNEAFEQIDMALDHNVNIIDTAEMYPVNPLSMETQGNSEKIIGDWVKKSKRRDEVIIATKVSGKGYQAVRKGAPISRKTIRIALENSLQNLSSEYIDLYQLHWPNRGSYMFRQNWNYNPTTQDTETAKENILQVLKALSEYFDARNDQDWSKAVKYESKSGTYNTNSDGSFHKPLTKQTAASWAASNQGGSLNIYYPEAMQIADEVVFVRFYYEGMTEVSGETSPYRTRVTMNWVKENGKWVSKTQHYSPAAYGGVHVPQASDFDE